ncbi:hypothetical protein [Chitinophaga nivalis]|uniref:HTH cro/C1-type domain-containing protein n=1 Tax=Chitinophaga nivalis TaxID=2991709 RepID=A0ABT3IWJ0_9BACT|nr:hypothetical protein [Chitinophaga nivalis]MCW3462228.1 hypothetical protein [Chitinophaga nivalis]MCW3488080.1 hypothetical protein [Chitinophaga nivalis]
MSLPYYMHAGARLRRILRQQQVVILHYAKKVGLTPPGLYRYFCQPVIKRKKLEVLLAAVPITQEAFSQWGSLNTVPFHQGELLLIFLAQQKIREKQLAARLNITLATMQEWCDTAQFSQDQLQRLCEVPGLSQAYFDNPEQARKGVNWLEAYLDKCMEVQQCNRKISTLEKKIYSLTVKKAG